MTAMHALARLSALPTFVRRACVAVAPALRYATWRRARVEQECEQWAPDCDAGASRFRVTDRRRRWSRVRHFMDIGTALRHAYANDGVVWERYVGPTGAVNWWSLTDEECEARLSRTAADDAGPRSIS
jgi:hypothetical protein